MRFLSCLISSEDGQTRRRTCKWRGLPPSFHIYYSDGALKEDDVFLQDSFLLIIIIFCFVLSLALSLSLSLSALSFHASGEGVLLLLLLLVLLLSPSLFLFCAAVAVVVAWWSGGFFCLVLLLFLLIIFDWITSGKGGGLGYGDFVFGFGHYFYRGDLLLLLLIGGCLVHALIFPPFLPPRVFTIGHCPLIAGNWG